MEKLTIEEYVCALEKMKKNPKDRFGILGELGVTGIGITAGAAASGSIATAAGATTLLWSTTLASFLGGIFVTITPIGWIVGAAATGGALAYIAGKLVRSGAKCDALRKISIRKLEQRINSMRLQAQSTPIYDEKISNVITSIQYLVFNSRITQDKGTEILKAIEKRVLSIEEAFELLQSLINENENNL